MNSLPGAGLSLSARARQFLGTTAWNAAAKAVYNQPMLVANETGYYGTGKKMAIEPKFILVPRALRGAANDLFLSRDIPGASVALTRMIV